MDSRFSVLKTADDQFVPQGVKVGSSVVEDAGAPGEQGFWLVDVSVVQAVVLVTETDTNKKANGHLKFETGQLASTGHLLTLSPG